MKPTDTSTPQKKIIIIAGPNGAGKTTFAEEFLPKEAGCSTFVNADLIAAGLAPFEPERAAFRAGRLMLEEIYHYSRKGESFAFETTLSGRGYAGLPVGERRATSSSCSFCAWLRPIWPLHGSGNGCARAATISPSRSSGGASPPGSPISKTSTNRWSMNGRSMTIPAANPFSLKKE